MSTMKEIFAMMMLFVHYCSAPDISLPGLHSTEYTSMGHLTGAMKTFFTEVKTLSDLFELPIEYIQIKADVKTHSGIHRIKNENEYSFDFKNEYVTFVQFSCEGFKNYEKQITSGRISYSEDKSVKFNEMSQTLLKNLTVNGKKSAIVIAEEEKLTNGLKHLIEVFFDAYNTTTTIDYLKNNAIKFIKEVKKINKQFKSPNVLDKLNQLETKMLVQSYNVYISNTTHPYEKFKTAYHEFVDCTVEAIQDYETQINEKNIQITEPLNRKLGDLNNEFDRSIKGRSCDEVIAKSAKLGDAIMSLLSARGKGTSETQEQPLPLQGDEKISDDQSK